MYVTWGLIHMNRFLGIVENGRLNIMMPREHCCTVKLTQIAKPAVSAEELATSHELDLSQYEGCAIMVTGELPEKRGWIFEAKIIDTAGPILTEVVRSLFC